MTPIVRRSKIVTLADLPSSSTPETVSAPSEAAARALKDASAATARATLVVNKINARLTALNELMSQRSAQLDEMTASFASSNERLGRVPALREASSAGWSCQHITALLVVLLALGLIASLGLHK